MHVNGMLKDVTMFNTVINRHQNVGDQLKSLQTGHYIMDPINLSLNATSASSEILNGDSLMTAKVHAGFVNLRLTYQDYKLVMDSLGFLSQPEQEEELEDDAHDQKHDSKQNESMDVKATNSHSRSSENHPRKLTHVKPKGIIKLKNTIRRPGGYLLDPKAVKEAFVGTFDAMDAIQSYGEQEVEAVFEGFEIRFVNNITGIDMQFASFNLANLRAIVSGFSHQQRVSATLDFNAKYYNQELQNWEPMFEPWNLQADVWTVAGHGRTMQLRTDKPLYLNLTKAMVDAMTSTLQLVNTVEKNQKKVKTEGKKMIKYSKYMLLNLTEVPAKFRLAREAKLAPPLGQGSLPPATLESQAVPLACVENEGNHNVVIWFEGFDPLPAFDMDIVQSVEHKLTSNRFEDGALAPTVVLECYVVGGIKMLSLHSTVCLSNETVLTLQCGDRRILPGNKVWVSLASAGKGLQLRPDTIPPQKRCQIVKRWHTSSIASPSLSAVEMVGSGVDEKGAGEYQEQQDSYSFSQEFRVEELVQSMKPCAIPDTQPGLMLAPQMTVTCLSSNSREFHLSISASKIDSSSVVNLHIRPPFTIENVLACDSTIMVSTHKNFDSLRGKYSQVQQQSEDDMTAPLVSKEAKGRPPRTGSSLTVKLQRTGSFQMFEFRATEGCFLKLQVEGYSSDWSDAISISKTQPQEAPEVEAIPVNSSDAQKQIYIHCEMSSHASFGVLSHSRRLALYVPYWIFDATGLGLNVSHNKSSLPPKSSRLLALQNDSTFANWSGYQSQSASYRPHVRNALPMQEGERFGEMMSVSASAGTRISIRSTRPVVSGWSSYVSLDNAESQVLQCYATSEGKVDPFWVDSRFDVGLVSKLGSGRFVRTRMITFCSRHVIVNNLDLSLEVRQHRYPGSLLVGPGAQVPFHLIHGSDKELVTFRILPDEDDKKDSKKPTAWEWSGSFKISEPGDFGLIIRAKDSFKTFLVRVEVRASDATLFVVIDREIRKCSPFKIINKTAYDKFRFCQTHVNKWTVVEPFSLCTYSWDQPLGVGGKLAISVEVAGDCKGERVYHMDGHGSGSLDTIVLMGNDENSARRSSRNVQCRLIYVYLLAEGPTKVLVVSDLPNPDVVIDPRSSPAEQRKQAIELKVLRETNSSEVLRRRKVKLSQELKLLKQQYQRLDDDLLDIHDSLDSEEDKADAKLMAIQNKQTLRITIIEASSVSGVQPNGTSDVFAQVIFHRETRRTHVCRRNLNPWFDETFEFDVTPDQGVTLDDPRHPLHSRLKIVLFNKNTVAPSDFLGGLIIDLGRLRDQIPAEEHFAAAGPIEIQRWLRMDKLRHVHDQYAKVHIKAVWFPTKQSLDARDRLLTTQKIADRMRCLKVLKKQIRMERRKEGLDQPQDKRTKSQPAAPAKQILVTLKIAECKFDKAIEEEMKHPNAVRFVEEDLDEKVQERNTLANARMICIVTHGLHKRMCVLHDPDKNMPSIQSQGHEEKFEFYASNDEIRESVIRMDCYARVASEAEEKHKRSSYVHIGYSVLQLANAPEVGQIPFEVRAAELRGDSKKDDNFSADNTDGESGNFYWEKLIIPSSDGPPSEFKQLDGGQLLLSLTQRLAPPPEERPKTVATVSFPEYGISLIDSTPEEIFFFQVKGLVIAYEDAPVQSTVEFSVFRLQLDNCLPNAQFPIMLAPEAVPLSQQKPFLQLSMHQSKTIPGVPVSIYQYASFLMQKLKLCFEEKIMIRILASLAEFAEREKTLLGFEDDDNDGSDLIKLTTDHLYPIPESSVSKMFFSFLQLHPIAIDISLELSSELRYQYMSDSGLGFNPLKWIRNAAGTAIDIDEAPIRLNSLTIEDAYGNSSTLLVPIIKHYTSQVIREAYKVLGSLEILGNPVQLVGNLGEGVVDFFYEVTFLFPEHDTQFSIIASQICFCQ
jgi:hypothetical protein